MGVFFERKGMRKEGKGERKKVGSNNGTVRKGAWRHER
jgi:hypothetical protein